MIVRDFSLRYTAESAQPLAFFGDYSANDGMERLSYATERGVVGITAKGGAGRRQEVQYDFCGDYTENEARSEVRKRLSLSDNMKSIYSKIDTDAFMHSSIGSFYGMRITQNEPWETALCFVVSQFNNVKRIRLIMKRLIEKFGEEEKLNGKIAKLFPRARKVSGASISDLLACGAGFRARYIREAAAAFSDGSFASSLYRMEYADAKRELVKMDGIGEKVADCILLMGYKRLDAFPVDTWVSRMMKKNYWNQLQKTKYGNVTMDEIRRFAAERWHGYAGYAQQYLYWFGREHVGRP